MRNAETIDARAAICEAQSQHIQDIKNYRITQNRENTMSEESTREDNTVLDNVSVLKIDVDGADQSEFMCPRNIASSKSLSNLWRPPISVVGALVWGAPTLVFDANHLFVHCVVAFLKDASLVLNHNHFDRHIVFEVRLLNATSLWRVTLRKMLALKPVFLHELLMWLLTFLRRRGRNYQNT
jgi:hypothetical protein